jgi:hypothetical protein
VREEGEFANFTPKAREVVVGNGVFGIAAKYESPPPKATNFAERDYMGRVAALGCIVCRLMGLGATGAQVHHVRAGQGKAQRAGSFCTVPLCEPHHTGPKGIHGDRACLRQLNMSEMDLLDCVIGEMVK